MFTRDELEADGPPLTTKEVSNDDVNDDDDYDIAGETGHNSPGAPFYDLLQPAGPRVPEPHHA